MPIIRASDVLEELRSRYPGVETRDYLFRNLFSTEHSVFFDCGGDWGECLSDVLAYVGYSRFVAYSIVEDSTGHSYILDVSYTAIEGETLERFIRRYPGQLKPSSEMALQLSGRKYLKYVGAGYEE